MGGWKKRAQSRTAQANPQAMCTDQDLKEIWAQEQVECINQDKRITGWLSHVLKQGL